MNPLNEIAKAPRVPRYTARLVVLEEPRVVEQLGSLAMRLHHPSQMYVPSC